MVYMIPNYGRLVRPPRGRLRCCFGRMGLKTLSMEGGLYRPLMAARLKPISARMKLYLSPVQHEAGSYAPTGASCCLDGCPV